MFCHKSLKILFPLSIIFIKLHTNERTLRFSDTMKNIPRFYKHSLWGWRKFYGSHFLTEFWLVSPQKSKGLTKLENVKETFSKKIKWKIQFDHIFWSPAMIWKFWIKTELACLVLQNKSTERRQIQLAIFCQKYWSKSFFHFQFLEKFSFKFHASKSAKIHKIQIQRLSIC